MRQDYVFVANLYRQDFLVPGFTRKDGDLQPQHATTSSSIRTASPAGPCFGADAPRGYEVSYPGQNVDGHLGRWNPTGSVYWAFGEIENSAMFTGEDSDLRASSPLPSSRATSIGSGSRSGLFASGDKNPYDTRNGFDAIFEHPQFAGADTSFWIRQAVPLIGGGRAAFRA